MPTTPYDRKRLLTDPTAPGGNAGLTLAVGEDEMAHALGIHPNTLAMRRKAGTVPYARIGRKVLYPVHLMRRYLESIAEGPDLAEPEGGEPSQA